MRSKRSGDDDLIKIPGFYSDYNQENNSFSPPMIDDIPTIPMHDEKHNMIQFPDGSVAIHDILNLPPVPKFNEDDHDQNLAEVLPDHVLSAIGNHLKNKIEDDKQSQQNFYESLANVIDLLGIKSTNQTSENGESGEIKIYSSALFETLIDYVATIMQSILPSQGPVDCVILGEITPELEDVAYRKTQFFNNYLQRIDKGFDKELKRTVVWSILGGSIYCKVYIDSVLGRPTMRMIKPEDFIINRDISSHLSAGRKTQVHHMDKKEFQLRKLSGEFRDIKVMPMHSYEMDENVIQETLDEISGYDPMMGKTDNDIYKIYECHVDYRIAEDPLAKDLEIPLPYIISLDASSGRILRIQRNWLKDDYLKKKREFFVNFSLLPSLDGEGYGLVQYAGNLSEAATTITRELIKAGMYSNFPGGVYQGGMRLQNNNLRPAPGEFLPIETGGIPIAQAIQPLPYKEPSPALTDLKNQIEDSIRKPSAIINQKVAEMTPRAPMGSVLAMLESMQKVPNFVVQGYHKSFEQMLEIFNERFAEWLPPHQPYPFVVPGGKHVIMRSDFEHDIQVITTSDPSLQNSSYRFMYAEITLNQARQNPEIHNLRYAYEHFYKCMGLSSDEIHKLIVPEQQPDQPIPLDPITENQNLLLGKAVKAGIDQDHDAHILVHQLLQNDPVASQDQKIIAAMQAHVKEHAAQKLFVNMQALLGVQLPQDPTQIPIEMQNQIAVGAAQIAQQQMQAAQEQQQPQPDPALITAQALVDEVEVKKLQTEVKAQLDNRKLDIEEQKVHMDIEKLKADIQLRQEEINQKGQLELLKNQIQEKKLELEALKDNREHLLKEIESVKQNHSIVENEDISNVV